MREAHGSCKAVRKVQLTPATTQQQQATAQAAARPKLGAKAGRQKTQAQEQHRALYMLGQQGHMFVCILWIADECCSLSFSELSGTLALTYATIWQGTMLSHCHVCLH